MSNGHDMPHDPAPLTAEEHALAQRLSRLGTPAEPSPALDARILAAAHAAVATRVARSPRRSSRLPLAFGVAASLALAVGVAWQLRPLPEAGARYESEAASVPAGAPASDVEAAAEAARPAAQVVPNIDPEASDDAADQRADIDTVADPAAPAIVSEQPRTAPAQAAPDAFPSAAPMAPPEEPSPVVAQEAEIVFDQPAPMAAPAPPPPAPAAAVRPAASGIAGKTGTTAADGAPQRVRQSREQLERKAMSAEPDMQMDIPPATADAPEVRDAWLQRIRELAEAGKQDDARASLREFIHRYPNHPLPDDLRALLPER